MSTFCFFPNSVLIPNTTSTGFTEPSVLHVAHSSLLATQRSETIRAVIQCTSSVDCVALGPPKIAIVSFTQKKNTAGTYYINAQHKYEGRLISNAHSEISMKRDHVFKQTKVGSKVQYFSYKLTYLFFDIVALSFNTFSQRKTS